MRNLENQVKQLAITLNNRPSSSLPSNIEVPKRDGKEHIKAIKLRNGKSVDQHKVSKRPMEDAKPFSRQTNRGKEAIGDEQIKKQFTLKLQKAGNTANATTLSQHSIPELQKPDGASDVIAIP